MLPCCRRFAKLSWRPWPWPKPEGGPLKPRAVPCHQLQVANLLILNIDHNRNKEDNYKES